MRKTKLEFNQNPFDLHGYVTCHDLNVTTQYGANLVLGQAIYGGAVNFLSKQLARH